MKLLSQQRTATGPVVHHPYSDQQQELWVTEVWQHQVQIDRVFSSSAQSESDAVVYLDEKHREKKNFDIVTRHTSWSMVRVRTVG